MTDKIKTIQSIYAESDAKLTLAEREIRAQKIEEAIAMIRAGLIRLPMGTGIARSQLHDAISELEMRTRELRGTA